MEFFLLRVANSMVEYSAFNRFVPGSSPGQPNIFWVKKNLIVKKVKLKVDQIDFKSEEKPLF